MLTYFLEGCFNPPAAHEAPKDRGGLEVKVGEGTPALHADRTDHAPAPSGSRPEWRSFEQEKQLKYASLVANTIVLSNVADLTTALSDMAAGGQSVTPVPVASLSPDTRSHILRFGQYALDMASPPEPLNPQPLPMELAL